MIDDAELTHLLSELVLLSYEADLTETRARLSRNVGPGGDGERLRLALWRWVDERREALSPSMDRRSVAARAHRASLGRTA
jgi:hypothetical protein